MPYEIMDEQKTVQESREIEKQRKIQISPLEGQDYHKSKVFVDERVNEREVRVFITHFNSKHTA